MIVMGDSEGSDEEVVRQPKKVTVIDRQDSARNYQKLKEEHERLMAQQAKDKEREKQE